MTIQTSSEPRPLRGRVLFADDTLDNRILIQHMLKRTELDVVLVENGKQALDQALSSNFDVIVLDIEMPVMNGLTAAATMRSSGIDVPLIALTGHVLDEMKQKMRESGFDETLAKPMSRDALLKALGRVLEAAEL